MKNNIAHNKTSKTSPSAKRYLYNKPQNYLLVQLNGTLCLVQAWLDQLQ